MSEHYKLSNGMRVHLAPVGGTEAVTVLVMTKVGSRYETKEISGAAHFIEHLMFKGTERRPTTQDLTRELDAVGAGFNAFTGREYTGYYVKIDAGKTELAIDLLHDMLFHSKFDQEELDRERGVIIEEINMYKENPIMHVEDLLEENTFDDNALGWNIAGTHETMTEMKRDDIIAFKEAHYIPSKMVIAVAGKIDDNVKTWLEETFGKVADGQDEPKGFDSYNHPQARERKAALQYKDTKQVQLMLGFPSIPLTDDRIPALKLLSTILGGTMSSRLFIQVRERRGLAYMIRTGINSYEDTGLFTIQSGLDQSRLKEAIATILEEIRKVKEEGVTETELKNAVDNIHGRSTLSLEDSSERASWFAKQDLLTGEVKTLDEKIAELQKVTIEDIKAIANEVLDDSKMTIAAVGPYKTSDEFFEKAGL